MSNYYDENELIRRIQKGDESALAIIISEYHAYVGKIVYSILGSYSHKIDLLCDCFPFIVKSQTVHFTAWRLDNVDFYVCLLTLNNFLLVCLDLLLF